MARERTIKLPPRKRGGKLTVGQIQRAVDKVVRQRLEWESRSYQRIYSTQCTPLLEGIAEALDISEKHYKLAVKCSKAIRAWLKRNLNLALLTTILKFIHKVLFYWVRLRNRFLIPKRMI